MGFSGSSFDFLTPMAGTVVSFVGRTEATVTDFQQNYAALQAAGAQAVSAMEEVRPATRFPRAANVGYSMADDVGYAAYPASAEMFVVSGGSVGVQFTGSLIGHPLEPYVAGVVFTSPSAVTMLGAETSTADSHSYFYRAVTGGTLAGPAAPVRAACDRIPDGLPCALYVCWITLLFK